MIGPMCTDCGASDGSCNCSMYPPTCAHCQIDLDPSAAFDAGGLAFCSIRCSEAMIRCCHAADCERLECADNAPLVYPTQLCAYCETPVERHETAHAICRRRVANALVFQASAPFGPEGAA